MLAGVAGVLQAGGLLANARHLRLPRAQPVGRGAAGAGVQGGGQQPGPRNTTSCLVTGPTDLLMDNCRKRCTYL